MRPPQLEKCSMTLSSHAFLSFLPCTTLFSLPWALVLSIFLCHLPYLAFYSFSAILQISYSSSLYIGTLFLYISLQYSRCEHVSTSHKSERWEVGATKHVMIRHLLFLPLIIPLEDICPRFMKLHRAVAILYGPLAYTK